jgi:hypothetical protein
LVRWGAIFLTFLMAYGQYSLSHEAQRSVGEGWGEADPRPILPLPRNEVERRRGDHHHINISFVFRLSSFVLQKLNPGRKTVHDWLSGRGLIRGTVGFSYSQEMIILILYAADAKFNFYCFASGVSLVDLKVLL